MSKNVGSADKLLRMILGLVIILLGAFAFSSILISLIGVVIFLTGATRFCLLYKLMGIDTCNL